MKNFAEGVSSDASQGDVSENTKASAHQAVEKANQIITRADQAIKDLLTRDEGGPRTGGGGF